MVIKARWPNQIWLDRATFVNDQQAKSDQAIAYTLSDEYRASP